MFLDSFDISFTANLTSDFTLMKILMVQSVSYKLYKREWRKTIAAATFSETRRRRQKATTLTMRRKKIQRIWTCINELYQKKTDLSIWFEILQIRMHRHSVGSEMTVPFCL